MTAVALDNDAELTIEKYVSGHQGEVPTYKPGDTFSYTVNLQCTSTESGICKDAVLTDTLPDPLVFDGNNPVSISPKLATIDVDGDTATLAFTGDGLEAGQVPTVTIKVAVPANASGDFDGATLKNTASISADNADTVSDSANVKLSVAPRLSAKATKTASPTTTIPALPGREVRYTIGGANTSNVAVDSLVLTDPASLAGTSPYEYLAITDLSDLTAPAGADRVKLDWYDGTDWVAGEARAIPSDPSDLLPADPSLIRGLRFTFTNADGRLPAGRAAQITISTVSRDSVTEMADNSTLSVNNTVNARVVRDGTDADDDASAAVTFRKEPVKVTVTKTYGTDDLVAGKSTTATITAANGVMPVSELVVNEPGTAGAADLAAQNVTFGGFITSGADSLLTWPDGAERAEITYRYADGTGAVQSTTEVDTLPAPEAGRTVAGFTVRFTADGDRIGSRAQAILPFRVTAGPVSVEAGTTSTNTTSATVTDAAEQTASDDASAELLLLPLRVRTETTKNIAKDWIWAAPGTSTLVALTGKVSQSSTVGAQYLQLTDEAVPAGSTFWNYVDLRRITSTDIPSNSVLTVTYFDGTTWQPLAGPVAGPVSNWSFTPTNPASIQGLRFRFDPKTAGDVLPAGFNVAPRFEVALRRVLRSDGTTSTTSPFPPANLENSVQAEVANSLALQPVVTATATDTVQLAPTGGGGGRTPVLVDKQWLDPNGAGLVDSTDVSALTDATRTAVVTWQTDGLGLKSLVVTDDPRHANVATSFYDAFNLTRIRPITPSDDPLIATDKVARVRLYQNGGWVDVTSAACASGCDGRFGGYTLTAAESEATLAVEITFASRTDGGLITNSSADEPARPIWLDYSLRRTLRSDPTSFVLGTTHDGDYNTGSNGVVSNRVTAAGTLAVPEDNGNDQFTSSADADITIFDQPLNVTATKVFDQSELGLPQRDTTDPADYPLIQATLTGTNNTASFVPEVSLTDPAPGTVGLGAYDYLNLYGIELPAIPANLTASDVTVDLRLADGSTETKTHDEALALTPAQLADVVGVTVHFGDRDNLLQPGSAMVATGGSGTAVLTFQLRSALRSDPSQQIGRTTKVTNIVQAEVHSPGGIGCADGGTCDEPIAQGQDSFSIADPTYGVAATKTITPAERYEDQSKVYSVALSGQPDGTARTKLLTLTDATPTFWNAFSLSSLNPVVLPRPVTELQVQALVGVQYSESNGALVATCNGSSDLSACWKAGDWQPATNSVVQPILPAGVNAADVRGLRFAVRRTVNGQPAQWERPANPTVTVRLEVTRRDVLVYGPNGATDTPVPSTRAGMVPAPGEPTQGVTTDELVVDGVANWQQNAGPYTATASDTDTTTLRHRVNMIRVEKTPGQGTGSDLPRYDLDATIGYSVKITNTGSWSMTGLKLADQVTLVGGSSPLVPGDSDPVFTLKLDGATWTGASAALDTATGKLSISVPDGFVFLPGSVITIGANLQFRSKLAAGTLVSNDVTATSDRAFEKCEYTEDANLQPALTGQVDTCRATTRIVTAASTPISVTKAVKGDGAGDPAASSGSANYDDLGVIAVGATDATACASPNADGYYTAPCAPITRAGGTETWRLNLTNNGNVAASAVSAIDVLPTPGDTGVTIGTARKSRFTPTFLGNVRTSLADDAPSHTFATYYTTETLSPSCNKSDILNDTRPGGTSNCGTNWQLVTGATTASQLATAKAVKFLLTFTDPATGLKPGDALTIRFDTRTPAYASVADPTTVEPIAWNSVAVGSRTAQSDTFAARASLITEPRKVGVAIASGTFNLSKAVVTPVNASWAPLLPANYAFTLKCTSGDDATSVPLRTTTTSSDASTVTLAANGTVTSYNADGSVNLPLFADCTLQEVPSQGSRVSFTPASVRAQRDYSGVANIAHGYDGVPGAAPALTATNTYSDAGFTVSKAVAGPVAKDAAGQPVSFKDFTYSASCTFLGSEVVPVADRTFSLRDGQSKAFAHLPAGADCTVAETYAAGADSTSVTVTSGGADPVTRTGASSRFTLVAGDETATRVAYTNTYTVGATTVTKAVTGNGAAAWGNETFEVQLVCTSADANPATVYSATRTLSKANPTWTVSDLVSGASCAVTETRHGGANSSTVSPGTFTVGKDATSPTAVTVTNSFTTGSVKVTKTVLANGAATTASPWVDGSYPVTLACTRDVDGTAQAIAIPDGATRTLTAAGSWTATYAGLPTGATCSATEDTGAITVTPSQPAPTVTISGPATVGNGTTAGIGVTNDFPAGKLAIAKVLTGAGTSFFSGATFSVSCTLDGYASPVFTRTGISVTNPSLRSADIGPIPFGASCTVTETATGGADATPAPQTVVVNPDAANANVTTATFTNAFSAGKVTLTKTLVGEAAGETWAKNATFVLAVKCGLAAAGPYSYNGNVSIKGGQSLTLQSGGVDQLFPVGTHCWATETNAQGATNPTVDHDSFANGVVVAADPAAVQALSITATNEYTYAGFTVTKTVATSGAKDQSGTAIVYTPTFTFQASCTFNGATVLATTTFTSTKQGDGTWSSKTFDKLPTGASCTVSETGRASANTTQYQVTQNGTAGTKTTGTATTFTLAKGDATTTTAAFTNTYPVGSVTLAKVVAGNGTAWATGSFSVRLVCTFSGVTTPATVYDQTFTFTSANLLNQRIDNLPTGASCTVSEPTTGGANTVSIPTATFTVSTALTSKTITNTFTTGSVAVTKALKVDGTATTADPWASGQYTMSLACTRVVNGVTENITIPGGASRTITGAGTTTWTGLPTGASCAATETGIAWPSGAPDQPIPVTTYTAGVTVNTGTVTQTVTNDFVSADLQVVKTLAGNGASSYGAGPFTFDVSCTLAGFASPVFTRTGISLTRAGSETTLTSAVVGPIPVGATCAVTETGAGGATAVDPVGKVVTLSDLPASPTQPAAFTNTFTYAGFTVTKAVDNGGAVDAAGTAVPYAGSYAFSASCTFKGAEVVATADRTFTLTRQANGTWSSKTFANLPTGASCTVTETGTAGAASTRVVVTQGASTLTDTTATSATFTLASGDASATSVAFTNRYTTGGLNITKTVTGTGATLWGGGTFGVRLLCTLDNDASSATAAVTVFDQTKSMAKNDVWQVRNLPTGAACTVTEPKNGGANTTVISGGTPTITTANQDVTVTNTFTVGSVRVTKALKANGVTTTAQPWASGTYPVDLVCTKDFDNDGTAETLTIADGHQVITGAGSYTWNNLPTGASCTVTEGTSVVTGQPQATVTAGTVTVVSGATTPLTLTNDFAAGKLVVHKNITGNGAANGKGPFAFSVSCTLAGVGTVFTTTLTLTPAAGQTSLDSAALGPIPFTSVCTVTETNSAGAATVTIPAPISITPNAATANTSTATFGNDFTLAGFTVTKAVDNGGAQDAAGAAIGYAAASFTAACTFQGTNVVATADRTFTLAAGQSKQFTGLPTGAACTVTETATAGAASTALVVTQGGSSVATGTTAANFTLAAGGASASTVAFTNTYTTGSVQVTKQLAGAGAALWGGQTFTARLVCTLANAVPTTVYDGTHALDRDHPTWTVATLPTGASCSVTEPATGGANSSVVTGGSFTVGTGTSSVTVTNTFTLGAIRVTKSLTVDGAATTAQPWTSGSYTVELICTRRVDGVTKAVAVPGGASRTITGAGSATFTDLPTGATCVVAETGSSPAAQGVTLTPANGTVTVNADPSTPVAVGVSNDFHTAFLSVRKQIAGAGGPSLGSGPFDFAVRCTLAGAADPVFTDTVRLSRPAGSTASSLTSGPLGPVPVGAVCTVTETGNGNADVTPDPVTLTVAEDDAANVAVLTNQFSAGTVWVSKQLAGAAAAESWATDAQFTVAVTCQLEVNGERGTVLSRAVTLRGGERINVPGADGQPSRVPLGSHCFAVETDTQEAGSSSVDHGSYESAAVVTAGTPSDLQALELHVTNTYEYAGFTVAKAVDDGGAVDAAGNPVAYPGPFGFEAACSFNGALVFDEAFSLAGGASRDFAGLPAGAACTVNETDAVRAPHTTVTVTQNGTSADPVTGLGSTFTLQRGVVPFFEAAPSVNAVAVANRYDTGAVTITKQVTGTGAGDWGNATFTARLACTLDTDDDPGTPDVTVYDATHSLSKASPAWTVTALASGAGCTVTETQNGGASEPAEPQTFTVGSDPATPSEVTLVNSFGTAPVVVTKTLTTDGEPVTDDTEGWAAQLLTGTMRVQLACTRTVNGEVLPVEVPGGAERTLDAAGDWRAVYHGLPLGAECSATEVASSPAASSVQYSPASVTVVAGEEPTTIAVTNDYPTGTLAVTKSVVGEGAAAFGDGPFRFDVRCTLPGLAEAVFTDTVTLSGGNLTSATLGPVPAGATCTVTETDAGGATVPAAPVSVAISAGEQVVAELANSFDVTGFSVSKSVDNGGAVDASGEPVAYPGRYTFTASCTFDDNGEVLPSADRSFTLAAGESRSFAGLPVGANCAVTEVGDGNAAATTTVVTQGATSTPGNGHTASLRLGADSSQVAFTNAYSVGSVVVTKQLTGDGAAAWGTAAFTLRTVCTLDTDADDETPDAVVYDGTGTVSAASPQWRIDALPTGADCTVSETAAGGANAAAEDASFTVGSGAEPAAVTMTNEFTTGSVKVTKRLLLDGQPTDAEPFASGSYDVQLACTRSVNGKVVAVDIPGDEAPAGDLADGRRTITGAGSVTYDGLPTGADCTVAEVASSLPIAADRVSVDAETVRVVAGEESAVVVTNDFATGTLVITKQVTGVGAAFGVGPFDFAVRCTMPGAEGVVFSEDVTLTPSAVGTSVTSEAIGPIPVAAECTVTETGAGGADSPAAPQSATISDGQVDVTLVNRYSAGTVAVTKQLTGPGAKYYGDRTFAAHITCAATQGGQPTLEADVQLSPGVTRQLTDDSHQPMLLPVGSHCWAVETDRGGARKTTIDHANFDTSVVVAAGKPEEIQPLSITITNDFADPHAIAGEGDNQGEGWLAYTGSTIPPWTPALALGLVALGTWLVRRSRRRD